MWTSNQREIVEVALREWIAGQSPDKPAKNPAQALLESDFVGCGEADPSLSTHYKQTFAQLLNEKYRHC